MFYFWYRFVLENFDLTFGLMYTVGNHGFPAVFCLYGDVDTAEIRKVLV